CIYGRGLGCNYGLGLGCIYGCGLGCNYRLGLGCRFGSRLRRGSWRIAGCGSVNIWFAAAIRSCRSRRHGKARQQSQRKRCAQSAAAAPYALSRLFDFLEHF
ncbi:MAG: hypothetical protein IK061_09715, partial [Desulfovibrio sp.]|nr:hypothetical protein [Desulfovibrio sp.]